METVALIARKTGTLEATKSIRAMREYITGSVFALVFVCKRVYIYINNDYILHTINIVYIHYIYVTIHTLYYVTYTVYISIY